MSSGKRLTRGVELLTSGVVGDDELALVDTLALESLDSISQRGMSREGVDGADDAGVEGIHGAGFLCHAYSVAASCRVSSGNRRHTFLVVNGVQVGVPASLDVGLVLEAQGVGHRLVFLEGATVVEQQPEATVNQLIGGGEVGVGDGGCLAHVCHYRSGEAKSSTNLERSLSHFLVFAPCQDNSIQHLLTLGNLCPNVSLDLLPCSSLARVNGLTFD